MPKRQYTEEEKAVALAALTANAGNAEKTAQQIGVPRNTLREWAKGSGVNEAVPAKQQRFERDMADECVRIAREAVRLMHGKMECLNGLQLMTLAGIAIDKALVLQKMLPPESPQDTELDLSSLSMEEKKVLVSLLTRAIRRNTGDPHGE